MMLTRQSSRAAIREMGFGAWAPALAALAIFIGRGADPLNVVIVVVLAAGALLPIYKWRHGKARRLIAQKTEEWVARGIENPEVFIVAVLNRDLQVAEAVLGARMASNGVPRTGWKAGLVNVFCLGFSDDGAHWIEYGKGPVEQVHGLRDAEFVDLEALSPNGRRGAALRVTTNVGSFELGCDARDELRDFLTASLGIAPSPE